MRALESDCFSSNPGLKTAHCGTLSNTLLPACFLNSYMDVRLPHRLVVKIKAGKDGKTQRMVFGASRVLHEC